MSPYSMPLWTILTKWPEPTRPAMQVAEVSGAAFERPSRRGRDRTGPGREGFEDRFQLREHLGFGSDHQTVAAFESPHAAAGSDIGIVNALRLQHCAARRTSSLKYELPPSMRISPDSKHLGQFPRPWFPWVHPAGPSATRYAVCAATERTAGSGSALDAFLFKFRYLRRSRSNTTLMPAALQSPRHVGAHAAKADYSDLHLLFLLRDLVTKMFFHQVDLFEPAHMTLFTGKIGADKSVNQLERRL